MTPCSLTVLCWKKLLGYDTMYSYRPLEEKLLGYDTM